jgi:hypothetical protein
MFKPTDPVHISEKLQFGEDAVRDPISGRIFEQGHGALPKHEQAAFFRQQAAIAADMPKVGECDPKGRLYETGSGCLTKTAQRAMRDRNANPAQAKLDDARATAAEAAAEVKQLATAEEAALAAMASPFLNDNTAATKH